MIEVKVGQVWRHEGSGGEWEVMARGSAHVIIRQGDAETPYSILELVCNFHFVKDAISALSDLEIVQKALQLKGAHYMRLCADGSWHDFSNGDNGPDLESLITWAKQTLGMEI